MFKPGDKAWHPQYGDGLVHENTQHKTVIQPLYYLADEGQADYIFIFPNGKAHESDLNPVIFHKEQKFDLSEPEPEIGTWGYFWDEGISYGVILSKLTGKYGRLFVSLSGDKHDNFSPSLPQHIKDMMEGKG